MKNKVIHHQPKIHRPAIWAAALTIVTIVVILASGLIAVQAGPASITFTIDTAYSDNGGFLSPYLNANRQGVNALKANQGAYNPTGYFYAATNAQIVTLYSNAGITFMSIGGTGTDTGYPPNSTNDLGQFFSFAQAANIQVNFLLAMSNTISAGTVAYTNYDETNAMFMMQNYSNYVLFLSIGNERDALSTDSDPGWGSTYSGFESFWPYWHTYWSDVRGYMQAKGIPTPWFGGPDAVPFDPNWAEWFWATNWTAYGANNDIADLTMHYHVFSHGTSDTMFYDALQMLSSNVDDSVFPQHETLLTYANGVGKPSSFTEFNAYPFDAPNNAGNTGNGYANALFALDAMHWWGQRGLFSLNWLDGAGSFFFINENGNRVLEAAPILYGCAAYNLSGGADAANTNLTEGGMISPIKSWSNPGGVNNAMAYAIADFNPSTGHCTNLYVTLINTSMSTWTTNFLANFTVGMPYPGVTRIHRMVLHQTPGYVSATNGITLGNADLNGAGPFQPQWEDEGVLNYPYYKPTVTNLTAQIFEFSCPTN